jgi:hypothetical protein
VCGIACVYHLVNHSSLCIAGSSPWKRRKSSSGGRNEIHTQKVEDSRVRCGIEVCIALVNHNCLAYCRKQPPSAAGNPAQGSKGTEKNPPTGVEGPDDAKRVRGTSAPIQST